ncbi:unnamed protein product [Cuscuta campestris]|uniref:No apical meristem-associated C-terminal domain-containing protein n=1 Tax=Cuscuta campestris TaxID=132261 RepID=A0A484KQP8_9ASTE|nr:unnamed protein product [Cuscuta campestris]
MWDRIEEKFFTAMKKDGSYRTRDKLTSKWCHINKKVRKFMGVYEECSRSRRSGTNDADVLRLATTRYQDDGNQGKKEGKIHCLWFGSVSASPRDEIGRAMIEQLRAFNLQEQERLKLKEKELKLKEQEAEMKVMQTDPGTLSEFGRIIYEQRMREIKEKYNLP